MAFNRLKLLTHPKLNHKFGSLLDTYLLIKMHACIMDSLFILLYDKERHPNFTGTLSKLLFIECSFKEILSTTFSPRSTIEHSVELKLCVCVYVCVGGGGGGVVSVMLRHVN